MLLFGVGACTNNQYASQGGYDDLYGGNPNSGVVSRDSRVRDRRAQEELSRSNNPDYQGSDEEQLAGNADYYDDSYLSARGVQRNLNDNVGYNAGFTDGFNQATRLSGAYGFSPYSAFNPYFGGSGFSLGLGFGFGSMFRMRPSIAMGYGMGYGMRGFGYSPYSMYGYSPFAYDPFYGGYGYGSGLYGYDAFGYGGYGYGGYGYGYNPWAYSAPVIIVNNNTERRGYARTYGNRVSDNSVRSSDRYNSSFVNTPRSSNSVGRSNSRTSGDYTAPRTNARTYSNSGRGVTDATGNSNARTYSRGSNSSDGGNTYYSRPRQSSGSNY